MKIYQFPISQATQVPISSEIEYIQVGDYLLPNIMLSDPPDAEPLTKYGMMRKAFMKEHMRISFSIMKSRETLFPHCRAVQKQSEEMFAELIARLQETTPPPCKNQDGQAWAGHMTILHNIAEEMVLAELIYDTTPLR